MQCVCEAGNYQNELLWLVRDFELDACPGVMKHRIVMFVFYTGWFVNHSEHNANMVLKEQSLSESIQGKVLFLIMMIEFAFA